ncbi:MAG: endolytic transglycosylase MltG [Cyclobacteriaceae bacterium]
MIKGLGKLIVFLLVSILLISFTFYGYQICYVPNILVGKEDRVLIIPNDATFETVQKALHEGEYVQDLISFSFLAKLMDYDENVKPGRYTLHANMSNLQAIRFLRAGLQEPVKITFNNVRLIPELSKKITRNLGMTPEEFEAGLVNFAMTNKEGFNKDNVLCMFIPNTYEVYYNVGVETLIDKMHNEFEKFWTDDKKAKAKQLGLSPIEVSILASIVQAETVKQEEAPKIAGLYLNRIKKGIPLQADPTLVFAVGDFTLKRVLNEHKEVDSPYNTYKNAGLPPGPINMPEVFALNAVLNYFPSDYIYMCAKEDFSGRHNFTASYSEHMRNATRYQNALTIEQRKGRAMRKNNPVN